MSDWKSDFNNAVLLWKARGKLASQVDSLDDDGLPELIEIERRYDDAVSHLSTTITSQEIVNYISLQLDAKEHEQQVACHILLASRDQSFHEMLLDRLKNKNDILHRRIIPALRVSDAGIIRDFCRQALNLNLPWVDDALSVVVAKNMLVEHVSNYVVNGSIKYLTHSIISMLGYLGDAHSTLALKAEMDREENSIFIRRLCAKSLLMIGEFGGLEFYKKAISERLDDGTLAYTIGRYANPEDYKFLLKHVSTYQDADDIKAVLQGVGFCGNSQAIPFIKDYLSNHDPNIRAAASEAISEIVGDWEIDPFSDAEELTDFWESWFSENLELFNSSLRYTNGEPFSIPSCAANMLDSDRESRELSHEELMIYSGLHLPFDEFRYFEDQQIQAELWQKETQAQFSIPDGLWIRHGKPI